MKRLLNMLSLVWKAYKVFSMLLTAWNFLRDHWDDLL